MSIYLKMKMVYFKWIQINFADFTRFLMRSQEWKQYLNPHTKTKQNKQKTPLKLKFAAQYDYGVKHAWLLTCFMHINLM